MNKFAIGFAAVAAVVVAGVDYIAQAEAAGKGPGEFSVADYGATVGDRVGTLLTKAPEAPVLPARAYLPDAPDGWERRAWSPEADGTFGDADAAGKDPLQAAFEKDFNASAALRLAKGWQDGKVNARAEQDVWEYVGEGAVIRLSARHNPTTGKVFAKKLKDDPQSVNVIVTHGKPIELGQIGGVTWYASKRDQFDSTPVLPGIQPVFLRGYIGDDIQLTAYAQADAETLLSLIEAIDFDGLNALQETPARKIGSDAPETTEAVRKLIGIRLAQIGMMKNAGTAKAAEPASAASEKSSGGGFLARLGLGGGAAGKAGGNEGGPKRLTLSSDKCQNVGGVGKFCGVD